MATGRLSLRAFLHPAPPMRSHAAASVRAAMSYAARTTAASTTLRPASAATTTTRTFTSATRSSASAASDALGSSGCTSALRWHARTVVPGFGGDLLAPKPSTVCASSSARTAAADAPGSSGCASAPGWYARTVVPGFGGNLLAPAPSNAPAPSSASTAAAAAAGSSISTAAAARELVPGFGLQFASTLATAHASTSASGSSAGNTAAATCTAPVRFACPAFSRTATAGFGGCRFSSSAANGDEAADPSSAEEEEAVDTFWPKTDSPTDAYFIVIGDVLKNASFSDAELRYLSDILANRLQKPAKPDDTALEEKVDRMLKVQDKQEEKIDSLVNATLWRQKKEKKEWFKVNVFGRSLDLPKVGGFLIRIWTSGGT